MKVSIVIPNYNGEKYIETCIDSIYQQEYTNYEIIIVDNSSLDKSCEIIIKKYPQVRLIKNNKNLGFSGAVNQGIKASVGEYVVLLNNDTVVLKGWLKHLIKCIESNQRIFSVCSKMIRYNEKDKIDDAGDEYNILGWAYKRGDGKSITNFNRDKEVFSSCGGAAIYRKSILNKIGFFDENFFAYMEDVDISYRAKINGYKNIYCSKAKVYHIGSATTGSKYNAFKVKLAARNNIYVYYKNMPFLQMLLNLPFFIMGCVIKYVFFHIRGFRKEYREGIIEGLYSLSKVNKVKFKWKNLSHYLKIEIEMIFNTLKYIMKFML